MENSSLEVKTSSLQDLLKNYELIIPLYQRMYSWKEEDVESLMLDILEFKKDQESRNASEEYFLGSIVLVEGKKSHSYEILDGQQRVTTITILISVIRYLINDKNKKRDLDKYLIQEQDSIAETKSEVRLKLKESDNSFFNKIFIQEDGLSLLFSKKNKNLLSKNIDLLFLKQIGGENEGHLKMIKNAAIMFNFISQNKLKGQTLFDFVKILLKDCLVAKVSVKTVQSGMRWFGVLNGRGLQLKKSDVLKVEIIPSYSYDDLTWWDDFERKVVDVDLFLEHVRTIHTKKRSSGDVIREFQDDVLKLYKNKKTDFFSDVIKPYGEIWVDLREKFGNEEQYSIPIFKWIKFMDYSDWMPVAMVFLNKFWNIEEKEKIIKFFDQLEKLVFYLWFCQISQSRRQTRLNKIISEMEKNKKIKDFDSVCLSKDEKNELIKEFSSQDLYNKKDPEKLRYLLIRIEEFRDSEKIFDYKTAKDKDLTIEHIMPQKLKEDSSYNKILTIDEQKKFVHRLGNLILLTRKSNSKLRNADFEEKLKVYKDVCFYPSRNDMDVKQWNAKTIENRSISLINICKKIWIE